jgi:hypothetical protein
VFLGDSLTEGVGSSRATYVTELARMLRATPGHPMAVHDLRLRNVEPATFNPHIRTNLAGYLESDPKVAAETIWIWNLAAEGRTIDTDLGWLPLLHNLEPERVFIYRGSLESILRPAPVRDGRWPAWVPMSWRGFVGMDPRCYFSTTWWRWLKQVGVDAAKQRVRLHLLRRKPGSPLFDAEMVLAHYASLLEGLRPLQASVLMLGLLPPDESTFPGSAAHFAAINSQLRLLAEREGVGFFEWSALVDRRRDSEPLLYRDGFHPTLYGARVLAELLHSRLATTDHR